MNIEITLDNLVIGDLLTFDRFAAQQATNAELLDMLDRVVVGGARHLPFTAMKQIMAALSEKMKEAGNPETPEGN